MNSHRQALKKVKVLGYPFAGGQPRGGVELTPGWLKSQKWFRDLQYTHRIPVLYEEVPVTSGFCNAFHPDRQAKGAQKHEILEAKNMDNVLQSSLNLKNATVKAIKEGFFPIVLGGDHSQAIGSLAGYKKLFPDGRIIWIDAHIDANTPITSPSRNAHGMPLAFLSGQVPKYRTLKCVDMDKDVCYFGIRSFEEGEVKFMQQNKCLVFESETCHPTDERVHAIHREIYDYFQSQPKFRQGEPHYWISFDIDGVDNSEFKSTGTDEGDGLKFDFIHRLLGRFLPRASGMDLTEINFQLTHGDTRVADEARVRELFEFIVDQVNQPHRSEIELFEDRFMASKENMALIDKE